MSAAESVLQARELFQQATYVVALTGAGTSTPSGIPDFRSPGSGVWGLVDSMEIASIYAFRRQPNVFYDWIRPMIRLVQEATPNPAHFALAAMEQAGVLRAIITQNIDGLHARAGSRRVIELHGNFHRATCIGCYQVVPGETVLQHLLTHDTVPTCRQCGAVLKPNIILFGEQLPFSEIQSSHEEARRCDLMLVVGSSLTVEPAASLPELARQHGARLILVNLQPTRLDSIADIVIRADVAQILPRLVDDRTGRLQ